MTETQTAPPPTAAASPFAFVATGDIPASPPPASEVGPVRWVRENLFSGWLNSILTILSLLALYGLLSAVVPWLFLNSVWAPEQMSLKGCREVNPHGACLAVINERWLQFVFGFYPAELYWRPTLAFLLMIAALWPALFASAPRQLLWLTAAYPAIGYWLIWGGSVWGPALALAAPGVGYLVWRYGGPLINLVLGADFGAIMSLVAGGLAVVLWWMFAVVPLDGAIYDVLPLGLEPVESAKLGGFLLSMIIGATGIAASLPLGVLLALGRQSSLFIVRGICVAFIECMRGVPLITLLFVASTLLNYFLPPGTEFDVILRVCIMVTFFASAYMAEVIRGGLASLPKGQYEAGDAMGLDYWKSMRLIVLPQALKVSIPGIVNTFIGLFKDTVLVSQISLFDPLGLLNPIRADAAWNGIVWELYGFVALFFFVFCFGMSRYSMYLEQKLKTDHR